LSDAEVHAKARAVLDYWFEALTPDQHFAKDEGVDRTIRERFGPLRDLVLGSGAAGWRDDPETLLAAVILLDQFSRNIHRGEAEAFAADPLARDLACLAIDKAWDARFPPEQRHFLYMPLSHAEDPALQALCLDRVATLDDEKAMRYAREHAEVIEQFGRFPTRNAALGRESSPEEESYLSQPGVGW
jgi:uncharacterized protein (DUF924 family)